MCRLVPPEKRPNKEGKPSIEEQNHENTTHFEFGKTNSASKSRNHREEVRGWKRKEEKSETGQEKGARQEGGRGGVSGGGIVWYVMVWFVGWGAAEGSQGWRRF